ncbi:MAG TPA: hypothetical protein VNV16_11870 [Methylibium sp.]|nr:hypothetical protein [Methylibium sp.]
MSTIATITTKTYKATLQDDGTVIVSGLHATAIADETPDTAAALERRNAMRREIRSELRKVAGDAEVIDFRRA